MDNIYAKQCWDKLKKKQKKKHYWDVQTQNTVETNPNNKSSCALSGCHVTVTCFNSWFHLQLECVNDNEKTKLLINNNKTKYNKIVYG